MSETVVAIDIGATKTVVAILAGNEIEEVARFPTASEPADQVTSIVEAINGDPRTAGSRAIGIGSPGPLEASSGTILSPPNLPGWWGFPLGQELEKRLSRPVKLENDANLGALGEAVYGSGREFRSIYYVTISTGIGAGFVIDGKLFSGHRGMGGEVYAVKPGHFAGVADGDNVNELASGPGLIGSAIRRLEAGAESVLAKYDGEFGTHELLAAADDGDAVGVDTLEAGRNAIAGLLITVLFSVAPDAIVLAGGLCTENRWYVDPVREKVKAWMTIPELADVPIERATLWDRAVLYGAARLVL